MNNNIEKTLKEFDEKFPNYLEGELDFEELEWSKVPTPEAIKAFIIQALQNKEKEVEEERMKWWLPIDTLLAELALGKISNKEFITAISEVFADNEVAQEKEN